MNNQMEVNIEEHPLITRRYIMPTPMLLGLVASVFNWVLYCAPGGMVHGYPRRGKSRSRQFLISQLPISFPGMFVFTISSRSVQVATERSFFQHVLSCAGHLTPSSGTSYDMRDRLNAYLAEIALKRKQKRMVLFVDEAQKLHYMHYNWLIDIHNDLCERGVDLTVILIGQNELIGIRNDYHKSGKLNIIGRFMTYEHELFGIKTIEELGDCLNCYDDGEKVDWPSGSGISYTEYFFPSAYKAGWRLGSIKQQIWNSCEFVKSNNRVRGDMEITMEVFSRVVERVMIEARERNPKNPDVSDEDLRQIIVASGYGLFSE